MLIKRLVVVIFALIIVLSVSVGCSTNKASYDNSDLVNKSDATSATLASSDNDTQLSELKRQIDMLQFSLSSQTANEAVESWARGVKTRNGALQFAVLSPELQMKMRQEFAGNGWVTGASSPWVNDFNITNTGSSVNLVTYEIHFNLASSTGNAGDDLVKVSVQQNKTTWYITKATSDTKMFNLNLN